MNSTILTKVNTVTPRNFAQQCDWMNLDKLSTDNDFSFLQAFVKLCHKNANTIKDMRTAATIDAFTSRGAYRYTIYAKHIVRVDLNTTKKKFYQIS